MQALYALSRGRSPKAQVGDVILQSGDGEPFHARGLFARGDGFNPGDFIGFYTGTWTDSRCRGDYVLEYGDDVWRVVPPKLSRAASAVKNVSVPGPKTRLLTKKGEHFDR